MNTSRVDRVIPLLRRLVSEFLKQEINHNVIVTVTDISLSSDMKNSTVRISVYPDNKETEIISQLKKQVSSLHEYVVSKTKMRTVPKFTFEIDKGEKNRQRIDKLLYDNK